MGKIHVRTGGFGTSDARVQYVRMLAMLTANRASGKIEGVFRLFVGFRALVLEYMLEPCRFPEKQALYDRFCARCSEVSDWYAERLTRRSKKFSEIVDRVLPFADDEELYSCLDEIERLRREAESDYPDFRSAYEETERDFYMLFKRQFLDVLRPEDVGKLCMQIREQMENLVSFDMDEARLLSYTACVEQIDMTDVESGRAIAFIREANRIQIEILSERSMGEFYGRNWLLFLADMKEVIEKHGMIAAAMSSAKGSGDLDRMYDVVSEHIYPYNALVNLYNAEKDLSDRIREMYDRAGKSSVRISGYHASLDTARFEDLMEIGADILREYANVLDIPYSDPS